MDTTLFGAVLNGTHPLFKSCFQGASTFVRDFKGEPHILKQSQSEAILAGAVFRESLEKGHTQFEVCRLTPSFKEDNYVPLEHVPQLYVYTYVHP